MFLVNSKLKTIYDYQKYHINYDLPANLPFQSELRKSMISHLIKEYETHHLQD